jgi:hypothetical protein
MFSAFVLEKVIAAPIILGLLRDQKVHHSVHESPQLIFSEKVLCSPHHPTLVSKYESRLIKSLLCLAEEPG